jgi:hypothetical protein
MDKLKKIWTFVLLLLVAAPIFFYAGFSIKQKIIQHQMHELLEGSYLQTISVDSSKVIWLNAHSEALVDGRMFDVKSYNIKNGITTLTGLYDAAEHKLNNDFLSLLKSKKKESAPIEQLLLKFIFTAGLLKHPFEISFVEINNLPIYFDYNENSVAQYLPINNPPPLG